MEIDKNSPTLIVKEKIDAIVENLNTTGLNSPEELPLLADLHKAAELNDAMNDRSATQSSVGAVVEAVRNLNSDISGEP